MVTFACSGLMALLGLLGTRSQLSAKIKLAVFYSNPGCFFFLKKKSWKILVRFPQLLRCTDLIFAFKSCELSWCLPFTRHTNFSEIKSSQRYLQETPKQRYCSTWWIKDVNFHQVLSRWSYLFRIFISLSLSAWVGEMLLLLQNNLYSWPFQNTNAIYH